MTTETAMTAIDTGDAARPIPRNVITTTFIRYLPLVILAVLWEAVSRLGLVSTLALPSLNSVIKAWFSLLMSGDLVTNGLDSLWRLGAGLTMAIVIGGAIGILMAFYKPFDILMNPIVQVFYPMPKSALIPVTVLWLGFGHWSKIVLIFIGCMLPVTLSAYNGARGTEQFLVWSARSMGASRRRTSARGRAAERAAGDDERHPHCAWRCRSS